MRVDYRIEQPPPQSLWKRWKAKLVTSLKGQPQKEPGQAASSEPPVIHRLHKEEPEGDYLQRPEFAWQKSQFLRRDPMRLGAPISQQQSLLFQLPIEIRELVYKHVFGPSLIHIEAISRRLAHVTCIHWQPGDGWDGHTHVGTTGWGPEAPRTFEKSTSPNDQLLAICLSCKLMWVICFCLLTPEGCFGAVKLDADQYHSYHEALPFLYAIPIFTIRQPIRILVVDHLKFSESLHYINKLSITKHFDGFPQDTPSNRAPWEMTGWLSMCDTLASMTNLHYLCITISQKDFDKLSPCYSIKCIQELLEPLKRIKIVAGGQFDVVTYQWRMPCEMNNVPFRILEEVPVSALSKMRLKSLGGFEDPCSRIKPVSSPRVQF